MPFFHGIEIIEPVTGNTPVQPFASSVIGLVATAPDADAVAFPLDKPILVTNVNAAIAKAGVTGTLAIALKSIASITTPIIIVVRVAPGADAAAQAANVIGSQVGGVYTGLQALLAAAGQGLPRPRIIGAPGLETATTVAEMASVAAKLYGVAYARIPAITVAAAITFRDLFDQRELMLIWPETKTGDALTVSVDVGARALAQRAYINETKNFVKTLSNEPLRGVNGTRFDVGFDLGDSSNDAGLLNENEIVTIVRHSGAFRFWGNRTCSADPNFAFESAVWTSHALRDMAMQVLARLPDQPITHALVRDGVEALNAGAARMIARGELIGFRAYFDPAENTAAELAGGRLAFNWEYTPISPAEHIVGQQIITDKFYAQLAGGL